MWNRICLSLCAGPPVGGTSDKMMMIVRQQRAAHEQQVTIVPPTTHILQLYFKLICTQYTVCLSALADLGVTVHTSQARYPNKTQ